MESEIEDKENEPESDLESGLESEIDDEENEIEAEKEDTSALTPEEKEKLSYVKGLITGAAIVLLTFGIAFFIRCVNSGAGSETLKDLNANNSAASSNSGSSVLTKENENKIKNVEALIDQYYLEDVSKEDLMDGMLAGMMYSLEDPYSVYYTKEELTKLMEKTEGAYYGIGAYVGLDKDTGYAYIPSVLPDTPAQAAGIMSGDLIYAVDGVEVYGLDTSEVVSMIKGEEGTDVVITIYRFNNEKGYYDTFDFTITRKKIDRDTVQYEMLDNQIAYIWVYEFDKVTEQQFKDALGKAREEGMKGLIIDLRDNPGGDFNVAIDMARMILPNGTVVYTEDKNGTKQNYDNTNDNRLEVPLAVLINGNSASASEVLTGAIKDYGVGHIMGTTSYGKGIVQRVVNLADGSAIKLTICKYFTPNGVCIHGTGIEPDEEVVFDSDTYRDSGYDNQKNAAYEYVLGQIQ